MGAASSSTRSKPKNKVSFAAIELYRPPSKNRNSTELLESAVRSPYRIEVCGHEEVKDYQDRDVHKGQKRQRDLPSDRIVSRLYSKLSWRGFETRTRTS